VFLLTQFLPQYVPPLHPKSDWLHRALTLQWDFLFPFHGGSGPLGFYVSFLYITLSWIVGALLLVVVFRKPALRAPLLALCIPIALSYNLLFTEEFHFGYINGSAPTLLSGVVEFIKNNPDITKVVVYNDNGGDEIKQIGKYERRLYVDPKFNTSERVMKFDHHFLQIDIPRPPTGPYERSFDACRRVYFATDKYISASVYDCRDSS
jgi:hypothetical protein